MEVTEEEVEQFLREFKQKLEIFDIVFLNREKNLQALLDLEIVRASRKEYLKALTTKDYFNGPFPDQFGGRALWEFGKKIKGKEVYIKVTPGTVNKPVICISFHLAEYKIKYPFK